MTLDEEIVQALYETLNYQRPTRQRYRAIDHTVAARRARRRNDLHGVVRGYSQAVKELKSSSNDKAHRAVRMMEEEITRLRYEGYGRS